MPYHSSQQKLNKKQTYIFSSNKFTHKNFTEERKKKSRSCYSFFNQIKQESKQTNPEFLSVKAKKLKPTPVLIHDLIKQAI